MKKYLMLLFMCLTIQGFAQIPTARTTTKLDETTVVKDVSGTVLPYIIWKKLLQSGEYSVRPVEKDSKEFVVYQMSAEEKATAASMGKPRASDNFKEGDKFRGEKITDINGVKYDLKTVSDKIYVINFWFINCPPCKQEIPELNELVKQYKENKNVVFLAIALDDKYSLKQFLKTTPFDYNVVDDGRYYATKYGITSYPTHVIVGKDGLVKFSTVGLAANTVYWIEKTIKEQLAGI